MLSESNNVTSGTAHHVVERRTMVPMMRRMRMIQHMFCVRKSGIIVSET